MTALFRLSDQNGVMIFEMLPGGSIQTGPAWTTTDAAAQNFLLALENAYQVLSKNLVTGTTSTASVGGSGGGGSGCSPDASDAKAPSSGSSDPIYDPI